MAIRRSSRQGKAVRRGSLRRLRSEWKLGSQSIAGKFGLFYHVARRGPRYSGVQAPGDAIRSRLSTHKLRFVSKRELEISVPVTGLSEELCAHFRRRGLDPPSAAAPC